MIRYTIFLLIFISMWSCTTYDESVIKAKAYYYLSLKEYDSAIPYFKKMIELEPNNKYIIHDLGRIYENKGFNEAAIVYYSDAIKIDHSFAKAYRSCGFAYYKLNELDKALKNYLESLKLEPTNDAVLRNVGAIYEDQNKMKKARIYYYKSLEYDSLHYGIMSSLASIEFDLGNYSQSEKLCYKVIGNLNEGKDASHGTLGLVYMATENYDSAIVHLNKAIEYSPNWCHYYNNLGSCYSYLGDNEKAIELYNKAIEIKSDNPSFFLNRADSESLLGLYEQALIDYEKAILLSQLYDGYDCEICFYNRANVKLEIGDTAGYKQDRIIAKELGYPDTYKKFSNLGEKAKFYSKK